MELEPSAPLRKKAVPGCAWQSLLCLRARRQKKKVAYSTHIHRLLNQTWCSGASCLAAAALAGLGCPRLLGAVALEAARLARGAGRSHLGHREVLLAMKLVLLRELSQRPPGSSGCELLPTGPGETGRT